MRSSSPTWLWLPLAEEKINMCLTFLGQFENHCGGSNGTIHNLLEFQQLLALALKAKNP